MNDNDENKLELIKCFVRDEKKYGWCMDIQDRNVQLAVRDLKVGESSSLRAVFA